jgi:hypothetical protein
MPEGTSYPISTVIARIMDDYSFSRVEFVRALGYRNIERGLRRLSSWMDQGEGYDRIIKQIVALYGHSDEIEGAVAATKEIKAVEFNAAWIERCKAEAATFHPFIHADGSQTVPNGIVLFGIGGGHRKWTTIEVPQTVLDFPLEEQLGALPELMLRYARKYRGLVPFFGVLTGFKFVRLLDYFQYDAEGDLIEHVQTPFRQGSCSVQLR